MIPAYQAGDDLAVTNVRTYFNRPDPGQRSQNNASDITPDGSPYVLVGNNAGCAPDLVGILDAFSRKTHEAAGVFDIRIGPLLPGGRPVVEPRRGEGANYGTHRVVAGIRAAGDV